MSTRTASVVGTSIALALSGLFAVLPAVEAAGDARPSSDNRMEHEARRQMAQARQDQAAALDLHEHQAHRPVDACSARLAEAWRGLGHFSDGYETWLLTQPPCSG